MPQSKIPLLLALTLIFSLSQWGYASEVGDHSGWYVSVSEAATSHWNQNEDMFISAAQNFNRNTNHASWLLN